MADITNIWLRHLRNPKRSRLEDGENRRPKRIESLPQVPEQPAGNRPSLVSEVQNVYARLVRVEETCHQIEQGQSKNSQRNPDLNNEQWEALQAIHRTLVREHSELHIFFFFFLSRPEVHHLRKMAYNHSLQSRSLRRFSDCLLPLLKREQDLESARQWLEVMKLSSSLIEALGNNDVLYVHEEEALMNTIEEIKALLNRLKLWFRCRYEDLSRKKDVTEEQGLAEPIFEFPNNIRHTCTTMPWTIFPALLVLWGVCWMFIIGSSQPGYEWGNAVDPMISPVPAAYDFCTDFPGIGVEEGLQGWVADDFDNRGHLSQDTLEELWPGDAQLMNDLIHPFAFAQNTPQDPTFLIPDMTSHDDSESLELAAQDTAEVFPVAAVKDSTLTACINTDNSVERDATGSADSSGYGQRTINADESEGTKSCFVCPDCQQTFARQFTLSRHRTEKHKDASSLEESLLCPNTGCKRSNEKPFKRRFNLKRHLESCKHNQEDLSRRDDQSCPRTRSTSTSASPSIQHRQDVGPDEAIRANGTKKRPRAGDDDGSNDEFLLTELVKKYKKVEQEIKEKQEELETFGKTIQSLKGSLRNS